MFREVFRNNLCFGGNMIMSNVQDFCTCTKTSCPRHPSNHSEGCSPCIELNLYLKKIPTCFFNAADPEKTYQGFDFEEFARIVTEKYNRKQGE